MNIPAAVDDLGNREVRRDAHRRIGAIAGRLLLFGRTLRHVERSMSDCCVKFLSKATHEPVRMTGARLASK